MTAARGLRASLTAVVPALMVANVLGYLVFVTVGRLLGPDDFGRFAAFWGLLFALGGMAAPVEQETARLVALGVPRTDRRLVRGAAVVGAGLAVGVALAFPITVERVLGGSWSLAALAALAGVGFSAQYAVRGLLLGAGLLAPYAVVLVGEAVLRAVALLAVVVLGEVSVQTCAVAVVAGSFAWAGVARRATSARPAPGAHPFPAGRRQLADLGSLVAAAGFTAAVVTGFPALAAAFSGAGAERELGVLVAALTVTRLPLLAMGPVQAVLVPDLVGRLRTGGRPAARRIMASVVAAALVLTAVLTAAALAVGPAAVRLVYGDRYDLAATPLAIMTAGAGLVAVQLLLAAAVLALGRHRWVVASWAGCFTGVLAVLALPVGSLTARVSAALVAGPAVGVLLALAGVRGGAGSVGPPGRAPERTSPA